MRLPPAPLHPDPGDGPTYQEDHHRFLAFRNVRHTILRLIGDHYRRPRGTHRSWQGCDLDLTGVTIDGTMDFRGAVFSGGAVSFSGARFSGGAVSFIRTRFTGGAVNFDGARFTGTTVFFSGAAFAGGAVNFDAAVFSGGDGTSGNVSFDEAAFTDGQVSFRGAVFAGGKVSFELAEFSPVRSPPRHESLRLRRDFQRREVLRRRSVLPWRGGTTPFQLLDAVGTPVPATVALPPDWRPSNP